MKTRFVTRHYKWYQHRLMEWGYLIVGVAMVTYCILSLINIVRSYIQ